MGSSQENFDYIIVGGGTAGLTLANRLSEDADVKVLVIEAGQDHSQNPLALTPGLVVGMYGKPEYDWNFSSTPQVSDHIIAPRPYVVFVIVAFD
jgi:choline dehydrogenase-like flavoprotein